MLRPFALKSKNRKFDESAVTSRHKLQEAMFPQPSADAQVIIREELTPLLSDLVAILGGTV
jgi:hypothetical protein